VTSKECFFTAEVDILFGLSLIVGVGKEIVRTIANESGRRQRDVDGD